MPGRDGFEVFFGVSDSDRAGGTPAWGVRGASVASACGVADARDGYDVFYGIDRSTGAAAVVSTSSTATAPDGTVVTTVAAPRSRRATAPPSAHIAAISSAATPMSSVVQVSPNKIDALLDAVAKDLRADESKGVVASNAGESPPDILMQPAYVSYPISTPAPSFVPHAGSCAAPAPDVDAAGIHTYSMATPLPSFMPPTAVLSPAA